MAAQNVTDAYVLAQTAGDTYNGNGSDQTYSINPAFLGAGEAITIVDQGGNNAIELPAGLEIISSQTISNQTILTLSNGAVIDIRGADTFTFNVGQNQAAGDTTGADLSFEDFATNVLGVTVPAEGDPVVDGGGSTVNDDGTADVEGEQSFELTADAASVDEGQVATFSLATTNVDVGTAVDYTITGVEAADISGGLTGSVTVGTDGTADIAVQVLADQLTEGVETLTVSVNSGAATASTQVQDTSVADAGSYISGQGGNGVVSDFNIEVIFDSVFTTDQRDAFEVAADYLSSLITSDLPDVGGIDDVRITALLEPIDGEFGVVGSAGPDAFRSVSLLPYEGGMRFDTADVDRQLTEGSFVDTVAHEMLHVLGFGTMWESLDLVTDGVLSYGSADFFLLDQTAELRLQNGQGAEGRLDSIQMTGIFFDNDGEEVRVAFDSALLVEDAPNEINSHISFVDALQPALATLIADGTLPEGTTIELFDYSSVILDDSGAELNRAVLEDGSFSDLIPAIRIISGDGSTITPLGFTTAVDLIGTFNIFGRVYDRSEQIASDLRFTGDNAIAAYNAEFPDIAGADANSATGVPVETDGGEGTAGGHWDEDIFTNEVMTGYGMAGIDDYMAGMTVAALEDMGYDTVFDVGLPGATMPQLDDFVMA